MNWQQQLEQVQQQAQGFAAQIRSLEEKAAKLSHDRSAFAAIENGVEKEMMDLARSVASFQEQTVATIRDLAEFAQKSARDADIARAEAQKAMAMVPPPAPAPAPAAPPPPPPPPPPPKPVEPPRPSEPLIFNEKKIPKMAEPVKQPPPSPPPVAVATDDDEFDLEAFK